MSSGWRTTPLAHGCDTPHHCPLPLRLDVLAHAPYFAGLDRAAVAAVEQRMRVQAYDAGEVIYRTGAPADGRSSSPPARSRCSGPPWTEPRCWWT